MLCFPTSSGLSINDLDSLCQHYLTILYTNLNQHAPQIKSEHPVCETYGEILYSSIDKLIAAVPLTEQDVFIDLGSGLGKVVLQFFLKSVIKSAFGIEILPHLHDQAVIAAQKLQQQLPEFYSGGRELNFILGDALAIPIPTATVAFINCTCFPQLLLNQLGCLIDATPSIHTVFSLRPISTLQRFKCIKSISIECSWDSALCYLYRACE